MQILDTFWRRTRQLLRGVWARLAAVGHIPPTTLSADVIRRVSVESFAESLLLQPRYADPKSLARYEAQIFSQNGEDGILAELFRRIGVQDRIFVEIGTGNGIETNTTFLLALLGWSGLWVEADEVGVSRAGVLFRKFIVEGRLRIKRHIVTAENVANILQSNYVPTEFDLLSLDIDRNTYHLWEALSAFRPRVVVVEYNASIPPSLDWKIEYVPDRAWNDSVYFGASLKAYELLGTGLGYSLVGCNIAGVNAFFVRNDLVGEYFLAPFSAERHYEPPRYWLHWRYGHPAGIEE